MVLTDDNFATIIKAVESGRNIYENIKKAIQFLLAGNFAAILVVIVAYRFLLRRCICCLSICLQTACRPLRWGWNLAIMM